MGPPAPDRPVPFRVVVDGQPQQRNYGGKTRLFQRLPGLSIVRAEAPTSYANTSEYARTLALIDGVLQDRRAGPAARRSLRGTPAR